MNLSHWRKVCETQEGIIAFAEEAAQILVEAGIASSKALGDSPTLAINRWSNVIRDRAIALYKERQRQQKALPSK